jgi:CubicO group peptidase (beta-lactamase class C family)
MKQFRKALIYLFIISCVSGLHSQTPFPVSEGFRIDSIMNKLMKKHKITGASIAIVDNNQTTYAKGYGLSDRKNKTEADENTVYSIGSITKVFTALAIMQLHNEGKIDLDLSAKYYLPELQIQSTVESVDLLKIKHLLTHTSGLPDDIKNGEFSQEKISFWSVIDELNRQTLTNPSNWKMNYSNIGFDLLGCVIERVSGQKYETYIRENFLDKLSMKNTKFEMESENPLYSKGYLKDSIETPEPVLREVPAGGLFSNVTDLSKFMIAWLNRGKFEDQQIIEPSLIEAMESNHIQDVLLNCEESFGYGMFTLRGYFQEDSIIGNLVGHAGDSYVYHSTMFMLPKINIGFVILSNSENGHAFCNAALIKLAKNYIPKVKNIPLHDSKVQYWPLKGLNNNIKDHRELLGTYGLGTEDYLIIKGQSLRKLTMQQGKYTIKLKKINDNTNTYSLTLKLIKIVPIRLKGMRMGFEKIGDEIFLKEYDEGLKTVAYLSIKDKPQILSQSWKSAVGKYCVVNAYQGNLQAFPTALKVKGQKIILSMKFPSGETGGYAFNQISETLSAMDGIGRGCGMNLKILPNGNLYFSGYELVKE